MKKLREQRDSKDPPGEDLAGPGLPQQVAQGPSPRAAPICEQGDNTTSPDHWGRCWTPHSPPHIQAQPPPPPKRPSGPGPRSPAASGPRPGPPLPARRYLRGDAEALEDVVEQQLLQLQLDGHVAVEGRAEQPAQGLGAPQVVAHLGLGAGPAAGPAAARRQRAEPQQGLGGDGGVGGGPARPRLEGAVVDHQRHRLRRPHGRAGLQHRVGGPARVAESEHPRGRRHFVPSPAVLRPGTRAATLVPGRGGARGRCVSSLSPPPPESPLTQGHPRPLPLRVKLGP